MNWKISHLFLLVFFMNCTSDNVKSDCNIKTSNSFLISAEELLAIQDHPSLKILDFRKEEAYKKEHIKNAVHIWRDDITDHNYPYGGMMAKPEQIEELFSALGINSTDLIVVYDDKGLCEAARLWWILQNYDFNRIKLLEGGIDQWKSFQGKTSQKAVNFAKSNFKLPSPKPSMKYHISKDEVLQHLNDYQIIDTRSLDEFLGKSQKNGAAKAGRIQHSKHMDWAVAINYHEDKSLKSIPELENIYQQLNIKKTDSIILYCHSGVRSAHTTFVLTQLLNYKNVKNYDGSWTEWSYYDDLPFETELELN